MNYHNLLESIAQKYSHQTIIEDDVSFIKTLLNKQTVILLLEDILKDTQLLQKISNRSYTHALGFDKIVLIDLSKDLQEKMHKAQLRLHIWDPQKTGALPIVEALHEHSFDFVSTVLSGHLENQQFTFNTLSITEQNLLNKLNFILPTLTTEDVQFLNDQIEIVEAIKLAQLGSQQLYCMGLMNQYDIEKVKRLTNFTEQEIFDLTSIEGHYVSNRITGERKAYKHILKEYVSIVPHKVLSLDQGDYYFHPYQLPHRLYYDNTILNSTILMTTPVSHNPEGGSLQRPTYVQKNEQSYEKIAFDESTLRTCLENYLTYLKNQHD